MKDIYSPLEIDEQWDQRAPMVEGETAATAAPVKPSTEEKTNDIAEATVSTATDEAPAAEAGNESAYVFHPQEDGVDNAADAPDSPMAEPTQPTVESTAQNSAGEAPAGVSAEPMAQEFQTQGTGVNQPVTGMPTPEPTTATEQPTQVSTEPSESTVHSAEVSNHDASTSTPESSEGSSDDADAIETLAKAKEDMHASSDEPLHPDVLSTAKDSHEEKSAHTSEKVVESDTSDNDTPHIHGVGSFEEEFAKEGKDTKAEVDTKDADDKVVEIDKVRDGLRTAKQEALDGIEKLEAKIKKSGELIDSNQEAIDLEQQRIDRLKEDISLLKTSLDSINTALGEDSEKKAA